MFTLIDYIYKDLYNKQNVDKQIKIIACDFVGKGIPNSKYPAKSEYEGKVYLEEETNSYYKCRKSGALYVWNLVEWEYELLIFKNSDIEWENFELSESLCSESELRFGCCEASILKFRIHNTFVSLKDKWLIVTETLEKHTDFPFQFGRYKVFSDVPTADRLYRDVTAYDSVYDIINASAIDWYNTILPETNSKVTMKQFRTSFVNYFGLIQEEITLANDDMIIEKTIQVGEGTEIDNETEQVSILKESALSGKDVITAICEINGCFGHIGRDGKFHYIYLEQDTMGLYPSSTLFPDHAPDYLPQAETGHLYPQSPKSTRIGNGTYISANYEDFICRRINKIQVREKENDIGGQYPKEKAENQNTYIIEDNFLVYGKSEEDLNKICKNIFEKIKDAVYRPFNAECIGNPCLEAGDPIRLSTKYELIESYILKRTLKGIQSLRDSYSAEGAERYSERVNSVSSSIIQLKGKTNTLIRNVEETISEIYSFDENGERISKIEQNANAIKTEVAARESGEEELSSRIEQTASSIELSVTNGEKTAGIHISLKNENEEEIDSKEGNIVMTGIVTFNNLKNSGETIINGGNILAESIDANKINVETLYLENSLRIKRVDSDGVSRMRTVAWMEDVEGQTYPNVVIGSRGGSANVVVKNELMCRGGAYFEKSFTAEKESIFNGGISTDKIFLQTQGVQRGVSSFNKGGNENWIIAIDSDNSTTIVGLRAGAENTTTALLRGNVVKLESAGSVTTSDERLKNSFKPLDEFDEVYMEIEPCAFKFNNGTSGRYHFGVKAQDVKKAFEEHGYTTQDFGGFVQMSDNPENEEYCGVDDPMGIIYTEFVMWNMRKNQMQQKEIDFLRRKSVEQELKIEQQQIEIDSLKESVSFLMERIG